MGGPCDPRRRCLLRSSGSGVAHHQHPVRRFADGLVEMRDVPGEADLVALAELDRIVDRTDPDAAGTEEDRLQPPARLRVPPRHRTPGPPPREELNVCTSTETGSPTS